MSGYEKITKKSITNKTNQLVHLEEYIVLKGKDNNPNHLLLKFSNNHFKKLIYIKYLIKEFNTKKEVIAEKTYELSDLEVLKFNKLIPNTKFEIDKTCFRTEVTILETKFEELDLETNEVEETEEILIINTKNNTNTLVFAVILIVFALILITSNISSFFG